ncbi:unnamed protein product (macronuclear) [Paramecium tetraurelia]|uniref:Protein kinase domain-containing protein n=1 Tax=Paramecium tetraurelia TaxID=5888 RepID=A0EA67_PARTE|nr:uncharacterized protein GSPATT00024916001 [Paramecium tetraurelia]CAK92184.1 unnamed protein product [Paramecium tetraurelia]|eukprot:XP_001459581.1 hypothetical protein (macronuclear) [Paramecium tetraurelia strain d4-2]
MGCLFGKQEQTQNRYQMKEYDKFKVLQLSIINGYYHLSSKQRRDVFNIQSLGIFITKQGAWNHWIYQKCDGKLLLFLSIYKIILFFLRLSAIRSADIITIISNKQTKFQISSNQCKIYIKLSNLPKPLFYQIIQSDEAFLKKNMINKEEVFNEQYSCFDESDIEMEQEPEIDLANQSLDLSGIDNNNNNVSPIKKANFDDDKINHQKLILDYLDHFCPQTEDQYYKWLINEKVIHYLQQSLHINLWFNKLDLEERFVWQQTNTNSFVKRRFQLIENKLLILFASETQDIIELIPLAYSKVQEAPKQQYVNKFGIFIKCDKLKIDVQLFFDTLLELHQLYCPYPQKYEILNTTNKSHIECVNKSLGLKLSIQQFKLDNNSISNLIIHDSLSNFKGVIKSHEIQFENTTNIHQICENIPFTLDEYLQQIKKLSEFQIRLIAKQLLVIFNYIHLMGVIIVCLNPNQIGVIPNKQEPDSIEKIAICNFCYSSYKFKLYNKQQLSEFAAPEASTGQMFDELVDSYLLYKLLMYIIRGQQLSPNFKDFLSKLEKRIPIEKALQHDVFKDETITTKAIENMVILKN